MLSQELWSPELWIKGQGCCWTVHEYRIGSWQANGLECNVARRSSFENKQFQADRQSACYRIKANADPAAVDAQQWRLMVRISMDASMRKKFATFGLRLHLVFPSPSVLCIISVDRWIEPLTPVSTSESALRILYSVRYPQKQIACLTRPYSQYRGRSFPELWHWPFSVW